MYLRGHPWQPLEALNYGWATKALLTIFHPSSNL